jgi:L-amino acid N-acyltransferase YncA
MKIGDMPTVAQICRQDMDAEFAAFGKEVPTFGKWDMGHLKVDRLVTVKRETILGWAVLSPIG